MNPTSKMPCYMTNLTKLKTSSPLHAHHQIQSTRGRRHKSRKHIYGSTHGKWSNLNLKTYTYLSKQYLWTSSYGAVLMTILTWQTRSLLTQKHPLHPKLKNIHVSGQRQEDEKRKRTHILLCNALCKEHDCSTTDTIVNCTTIWTCPWSSYARIKDPW